MVWLDFDSGRAWTITRMTLEEWIAGYGRAWRDKDDVGVVALFTDDAVYRSSPTGPSHVGPEAIAEYWRRATASQQDLHIQFGRPVLDGDRAAVEWWATMRDPDWRPEASSPDVTLPGCLLLRLAPDGRCAELREYYNPCFGATVAAPPGWGE